MATKGPRPKEYGKLDDVMSGLVSLLNTRLTQDQASVIQKTILKLERDVAEFSATIDKVVSYLYLSPYDNYLSVKSVNDYKAIRELLGLENFEESINDTSNESIPETDQVGSESSSD